MKPWKIIQELESDNSRLKKEAIIRRESDAENIEFFNGVGACLDGFRTFGIQKVPTAKEHGKGLNPALFFFYHNENNPKKFLNNFNLIFYKNIYFLFDEIIYDNLCKKIGWL